MKISGAASLTAPPERVWEAFHDPESLARCLPGCETLTEVGPHQYAMTIFYYPTLLSFVAFTLKAKGAGAPGTVDADVKVRLSPNGSGGTNLTYDADAAVGGVIGGVGQRMLAGVSKKMAGQFFTAVDQDIAGVRKAVPPAPAVPVGVEAVPGAPAAPPVYAGAPAPAAGALVLDKSFAAGVGLGAVIALIGVVVGAVLGRRR